MKIARSFKIILFIVVAEVLGASGSFATSGAIGGWYKDLIRSSLNPPSWVFGPAWSILFALMGISAFLIYEKGMKNKISKTAGLILLPYLFWVTFATYLNWSVVVLNNL